MTRLEERIFTLEKWAMAGNRHAVLMLIGAERRIRHALEALLAQQDAYGACDGVAIDTFTKAVDAIWDDVCDVEGDPP